MLPITTKRENNLTISSIHFRAGKQRVRPNKIKTKRYTISYLDGNLKVYSKELLIKNKECSSRIKNTGKVSRIIKGRRGCSYDTTVVVLLHTLHIFTRRNQEKGAHNSDKCLYVTTTATWTYTSPYQSGHEFRLQLGYNLQKLIRHKNFNIEQQNALVKYLNNVLSLRYC